MKQESLQDRAQSSGVLGEAHYFTGVRQLFVLVTSAGRKMVNSGFLSQHIPAP